MEISKIDKNFAVVEVDETGYEFLEVPQAPVVLEGLPWFEHNGGEFYRIPKEITVKQVNQGVLDLSHHTTGACIRFRTDSFSVKLKAEIKYGCDMSHMPRIGAAGFDAYTKNEDGTVLFQGSVGPEAGKVDSTITMDFARMAMSGDKMKDWIINFPLYGGVKRLFIGIQKGSQLLPPTPHRIKKPVVFYGSSITQGGVASRPGNMYPSLLCRKLDAEQINLGFSGSALGETAMAELIAQLDASVFVYDYDHNAPDEEHLRKTHEPFFKIIRAARPDLPIVFASKCDFEMLRNNKMWKCNDVARRKIIRTTYENAVKAGDKNVYFVDGETMWEKEDREACTPDGSHPNDLGFYRMYKAFLPVLEKILNK